MGRKSKEKRKKRRSRKDEIEESCTIPAEETPKPPKTYGWNGVRFSSRKEVSIAKFIADKGIESEVEDIIKLTALVHENKILPDNEAEIRFARLLMLHNIRFEYSKKIETKRIVRDKNNPETPDTTAHRKNIKTENNYREIDFWLPDGPIMVPLCSEPVQSFEIKGGRLDMGNWRQRRELRDSGYYTFVVLSEYISFYEKHGLLEPVSIRKTRARGVYQKPACLMENMIPEHESNLKNKLAEVLVFNKIDFEYVEDDRNCRPGTHCHRSIFFLRQPTKGFWCGEMTQAIMLVEGEITLDDLERWQEVSETFNTFLAIWQFVNFWHKDGFLRQRG